MIKKIIKKFFKILGYDINKIKPAKDKQNTMKCIIDKYIWEPYLIQNKQMKLYFKALSKSEVEWSDNIYKQLRFYSMQQMVNQVMKNNIKGDIIECGVWRGQTAYMISTILSEYNFKGKFHIFDAFEGGLSEKVDEDKNLRKQLSENETKEESKIFYSTEEQVSACLQEFEFINLYKGWIPERFNEIDDIEIAFAHIDVDLYEPTKDSLQFFYPRMHSGAIIVCDDYGLSQFPGCKKAVDEFLSKNDYYMFYEVPMGGCIIIK